MANEIQFPTSPTNGNIYSMGGRNYRYDSAQDKFVAVATATIVEGGGVTIYATIDNLPLSGNTQGDLAHVTSNNTLYFWNGSGWYKIALINNSPSISNVNSSYTLSDIGADTVITMVAEDPEGLAITYSIASDTSGNTATVVQGAGANTNIFTITPSTDANDNGTFSLTFRASDGVNIATAPASFTLNISTTVENSNYTTALITSVGTNNQVNNDFVDSSSSSHTITVNGDATQTTFSPYRHGGYSTYFDGTSDYLDLPASSTHNIGTGDFTLETWFNTTSASNDTQFRRMFMLDGPTGNATGNIQLIISSDGYVNGWTNTGDVDLRSSTGFNDGAWHHAAIVRSGSTLTLYVDGTSVDSMTYNTSITFNSGSPRPRIGSYNGTGGDWLGYLVDLRLVVGTAVYTSAFTPPTERLTAITNTSLLTCHLPYIVDGSSSGHSITVNGNTSTKPFSPYGNFKYSAADHGGSVYFDGSDYLDFSGGTSLDLDGTDFTIEAWVYRTSTSSMQTLANFALPHTTITISLNRTGVGDTYVYLGDGGANWSGGSNPNINTGSTNPLRANEWNHVALVRSGTGTGSQIITLYHNGVSVGTTTTVPSGMTGNLRIGAFSHPTVATGEFFGGYISDFRVAKEAVYTGEFTSPSAPLTAITNTSLLVSGTDASIIDKSQTNNLRLVGNTTGSTTQVKFADTKSMYFDGTGDYLQTQNVYSSVGTGDFTAEAWIYIDSGYSETNPLVFASDSGGVNFGVQRSSGTNYNINLGHSYVGDLFVGSTTTMVPSQWYHIAVSRSSGTMYCFVDGQLEGTFSNSSNFTGTTNYIGSIPALTNYDWKGYIQDARFTSGLARYTANFTPPTEPLKG